MSWIPSGQATVFRPRCCSPCVRSAGSELKRSHTRIPKSFVACCRLRQTAPPPSHAGAPVPIRRDRLMLARDCLGFCRLRTDELQHKTWRSLISLRVLGRTRRADDVKMHPSRDTRRHSSMRTSRAELGPDGVADSIIESLEIVALRCVQTPPVPPIPATGGGGYGTKGRYLQSRVRHCEYVGDATTHASGLRISGLRRVSAEFATWSRARRLPARPR